MIERRPDRGLCRATLPGGQIGGTGGARGAARIPGSGLREKLLEHGEVEARQLGFRKLFVLTTRAAHWFIERGFAEAAVGALPEAKKSLYNWQRRSKILLKKL